MLRPIPILLLAVMFLTACNAQVKNDIPNNKPDTPKDKTDTLKDSIAASTNLPREHPKLRKTQGSSEYANIHCGLQDKAGNLWFGTTGEGVYRYDGKVFTQFTVNEGLVNNTVWSILEDQAGKIWFGTDNGICRYDPSAKHSTDSKPIASIPIVVSIGMDIPIHTTPSEKNDVWSIMQDKKGILWFGTREGMYCYDGISFSRFLDQKHIANKENLQLRMVDCVLEDTNGHIWFCGGMQPGGEGICRYDGKSITSFKPEGNGWIRTVIADNDGNLCFATRHAGVCRYNMRCDALANVTTNENRIVPACFTNLTAKSGIDKSSVTTILEDKAGNIWIATELGSGEMGEDGGVWRYDGKSFTQFTTKEGLIHNGVFTIVEDKAGNIWFGTRNIGLSRYDGKTFTSFSE